MSNLFQYYGKRLEMPRQGLPENVMHVRKVNLRSIRVLLSHAVVAISIVATCQIEADPRLEPMKDSTPAWLNLKNLFSSSSRMLSETWSCRSCISVSLNTIASDLNWSQNESEPPRFRSITYQIAAYLRFEFDANFILLPCHSQSQSHDVRRR